MSTGSTANYNIPYPLSTDPVNVASDIQDLADTIDTFLTNPAFINNVTVNGGSVSTSSLTANVFNTNSTTVNIAGAATTTNIGNASGQVNFAGHVNVATGKVYEINNVSVLSATTLGSSVVNSSLTSVGTIATGTWNATTIAVNKGGTGLTSYTIGDIVYASGTTTLAKLAGVATGNALISGGVGAAPSWGKIGLTTHVSGTLPVANGGTNSTATPTSGGVAYGNGTSYAFTASGTANHVLTSDGSTPVWTANTGTGNVVRATSPSLTTPNIGSATASYLTVSAQDGVNEGGEMRLSGAGSFGNVILDNYQGRFRFHNGSITRLDVTDNTTWLSANTLILNMNTSGTPSSNASIAVERGSSPDVEIRWNETGDAWQFTNDGTTYYDVPTGTGGIGLESLFFLGCM